jgi:hypothetical protein
MTDPTAGIPNQDTFENIRNQWATWIDQPGNRQFLLQAGIALMQPPSFGDTGASQIGRAVGAGAEAATRGEIVGSKLAESEAKSEAAVARAGQAGERLGLEHYRRQSIERGQANQNLIRAQQLYQQDEAKVMGNYNAALRQWESENALLPANKQTPRPLPPKKYTNFQEWVKDRAPGLAGLPGVREMLGAPQQPQQEVAAQGE